MAVADGLPRVLYNNLFESATSVVASSESTGFEGSNIYDWKGNTYWQPTATGSTLTATFASAVTADCFAFYNHTLGTVSATIYLEHFTSSWVTDITISPTDDKTVMKIFTSASSTQWRIRVTYAGNDPIIAVSAFGQFMEFERGVKAGFSSPDLSDIPDVLNSNTQGGNFIGRTVLSKKAQSTITVSNMTDAYTRATWQPFIVHIQSKPFFFLWNERDYPNEAAFAWTDSTPAQRKYSKVGFVNSTIKINTRTE